MTTRWRCINIRVLLGILLFFALHPSQAGESLQPGLYYHEPSTIRIDSAASGRICSDAVGKKSLCEPALRVVIRGEATCDWPASEKNPCTEFGYEFEYSGAQPDTHIDCEVTRYHPQSGEEKSSYQRNIDGENGRISFLTFRNWVDVQKEVIFSEVHDCSYLGEQLATIEYIIAFEPGVRVTGSRDGADLQFAELPDACANPYLTEETAAGLLRSPSANKHVSSEYIAGLHSQCIYGAGSRPGGVGYVFKFMLADMFDVDKVAPEQLDFNATFANGGAAPDQVMESPGAKAYVFTKGDRVTLFVITGIRGSRGPTGRAREFTAQYHLEHPELDREAKLGALLTQANLHMQHWTQE